MTMTIFIALVALAVGLAVAATVRALRVDGYRRIPTAAIHRDDSVWR